jgi:hypothetical protein
MCPPYCLSEACMVCCGCQHCGECRATVCAARRWCSLSCVALCWTVGCMLCCALLCVDLLLWSHAVLYMCDNLSHCVLSTACMFVYQVTWRCCMSPGGRRAAASSGLLHLTGGRRRRRSCLTGVWLTCIHPQPQAYLNEKRV